MVLLSFLFRGNKKKKEDEEELNEKLNRLFSFVDGARMSLKKKKKKGEGGWKGDGAYQMLIAFKGKYIH